MAHTRGVKGVKIYRFPYSGKTDFVEKGQKKEHCRFSCTMESGSVLFLWLQAVDKLHNSDTIPESAGVQRRLHIGHAGRHGIRILFHTTSSSPQSIDERLSIINIKQI